VVSHNFSLNLAHDWEDVRLAIVVTVSANTKVALAGILIVLKVGGQAKNRIGREGGDVEELVVDQSESLHSG
jgi:hypothetical protein